MLHPITASTAALGTVNVQHVELADQISKDEMSNMARAYAIDVAIGGKADMPYCSAYVCF